VVFLGNHEWSVPTLDALNHSSHDVALVVTREPRPVRRSTSVQPTPVGAEAARLSLPLLETATVNAGAGFAAIHDSQPNVLVVVAFGEILSRDVLDVASRGTVNVHFSLLPRLRGASPVQGAILAGDDKTGVTTMLLDEGMDTGPILLQEQESIRPGDDAASLGARLADRGAALLVRTLDGLESDDVVPRRQIEAGATSAPKLTAADRRLDWTLGAAALARQIRAFAPAPGATTFLGDASLKVLASRVASDGDVTDAAGAAQPGEVLIASGERLVVATGEGALALEVVAPAGRKHMSAAEFVRGTTIQPGDKLL
jgi:methionyl-tRNA formyltransferase